MLPPRYELLLLYDDELPRELLPESCRLEVVRERPVSLWRRPLSLRRELLLSPVRELLPRVLVELVVVLWRESETLLPLRVPVERSPRVPVELLPRRPVEPLPLVLAVEVLRVPSYILLRRVPLRVPRIGSVANRVLRLEPLLTPERPPL